MASSTDLQGGPLKPGFGAPYKTQAYSLKPSSAFTEKWPKEIRASEPTSLTTGKGVFLFDTAIGKTCKKYQLILVDLFVEILFVMMLCSS